MITIKKLAILALVSTFTVQCFSQTIVRRAGKITVNSSNRMMTTITGHMTNGTGNSDLVMNSNGVCTRCGTELSTSNTDTVSATLVSRSSSLGDTTGGTVIGGGNHNYLPAVITQQSSYSTVGLSFNTNAYTTPQDIATTPLISRTGGVFTAAIGFDSKPAIAVTENTVTATSLNNFKSAVAGVMTQVLQTQITAVNTMVANTNANITEFNTTGATVGSTVIQNQIDGIRSEVDYTKTNLYDQVRNATTFQVWSKTNNAGVVSGSTKWTSADGRFATGAYTSSTSNITGNNILIGGVSFGSGRLVSAGYFKSGTVAAGSAPQAAVSAEDAVEYFFIDYSDAIQKAAVDPIALGAATGFGSGVGAIVNSTGTVSLK